MEQAAGSFPCNCHNALVRAQFLQGASRQGSAHVNQLDVTQCFEAQPTQQALCTKPPADPQDWLATVPEEGQTYQDYVRYSCVQRSGRWKTKQTGVDRKGGIVLVPIFVQDDSEDTHSSDNRSGAPDLEQLERFVDAFLGNTLPVAILKDTPAFLKYHASSTEKKTGENTYTTNYEWIPPAIQAAGRAPRRWVTVRVYENDFSDYSHPGPPRRHAVDVAGILACLTDLVVPNLGAAEGTPHSVMGVLPVDDLYSSPTDLFIAGLAAGGSHVAAFSLHRYHPNLKMSPQNWWEYGYTNTKRLDMYSYVQDDQAIEWGSNDEQTNAAATSRSSKRARRGTKVIRLSPTAPATLSYKAVSEYLRRSAKLLVHELLHLLLVGHCIYYKCLMNGTGHLVEDFAAPSHLCGIDLRKLQFRLGFDIVSRYEALASVWNDWEFKAEARRCQKQAERCRNHIHVAKSTKGEEAAAVPYVIDLT